MIAAWNWAEHQSVGKEQLYCASLAFLGFYSQLFLLLFAITIIIIIIIIFIIIVTGNFTYWTVLISTHGFYLFQILLPVSLGLGGKGKAKCVAVWYLGAGWG